MVKIADSVVAITDYEFVYCLVVSVKKNKAFYLPALKCSFGMDGKIRYRKVW